MPRDAFLAFCDEVERLDEEQLVDRFRLPAVEAETLVPALARLPHAAVGNGRPPARRLRRVAAGRRAARPRRAGRPAERRGLRAPGAGQRRGARASLPLRSRARPSRRDARRRGCSTSCRDEHGLGDRERLLLQVAALLHDIGIYVSLRAHHKHSQYLLAALADLRPVRRRDGDRLEHRPLPSPRAAAAQPPAVRRARSQDRLIVNKLAAILRVANALDAEHLQKVRDLRLVRSDRTWILELDGTGDLTMEQLAATARADMFARPSAGSSSSGRAECRHDAATPGTDLFINRELSWLAFNERVLEEAADADDAAARARQVRGHRGVESRRVLHGAGRRRSSTPSRTGTTSPDLAGLTPSQQLDGDRGAGARVRRRAVPADDRRAAAGAGDGAASASSRWQRPRARSAGRRWRRSSATRCCRC